MTDNNAYHAASITRNRKSLLLEIVTILTEYVYAVFYRIRVPMVSVTPSFI